MEYVDSNETRLSNYITFNNRLFSLLHLSFSPTKQLKAWGPPRCGAHQGAGLTKVRGAPRCGAHQGAGLTKVRGSPRCGAHQGAGPTKARGSPRRGAHQGAGLTKVRGSPRCGGQGTCPFGHRVNWALHAGIPAASLCTTCMCRCA